MKIEEFVKNQPEVVKLLNNAKNKDKLSHAYLFEGDSGTGTYEAALYFAMMLLCKEENGPCLKCNTCERILYNSHINVITIEPFADVIRKEQIENLMFEFSHTSLEGGAQIYIIKDAEKMNSSASNALLKFLEEPAPNHYAILVTSNHKKLLDTIVSRTQFIHFKPVSRIYIIEQLTSSGVDKDLAYVISYITSDLGVAKKLVEEGKLQLFINLAKKIVSSFYKKRETYVEYYLNKNLLLDENEKEWHYYFIDIIILINQELLKKADFEEDLYFSSVLDNIKIENINIADILNRLEILNEYEARLSYNVNLDLMYTSLFNKL